MKDKENRYDTGWISTANWKIKTIGLNDISGNSIEMIKKYGVLWPKFDLVKSIGFKWYLLFWKRKYLLQKEILRRIENDS